MLRQIEL